MRRKPLPARAIELEICTAPGIQDKIPASLPAFERQPAMSMKLLVVDDDADVLRAVKTLLESLSYEVLALTDSREALKRVERQKFDGVFIDAHMPYVDGFELVRQIRASASNSSVPIVMLTGYDDVQTMRAAFKAGITFFLGKPTSLKQLSGLLRVMNEAMLREKRSYVRLPLRTVVTCRTAKGQFTSPSVNIGEGGMLLESTGGLEAEQEIELQFSLPQAPAPVSPVAKVIRKEPPNRIAVQFVTISRDDRKVIQDYIAGVVKE